MTPSTEASIAITGCGWVTPFAAGSIDDVLSAAQACADLTPSADGFAAIPDEWVKNYPDLSKELCRDKGAWMAGIAFSHAVQTAALDRSEFDATRIGLVLGCGLAGQLGMIDFANEVRAQSPRFVSPIHFPQTVGNYYAGALARGMGIRGPNVTLASGRASGLDALIEACRMIDAQRADVIVAGAVEHLSASLALGLHEADVVLSEGACLFTVEEAEHARLRGVEPLATVLLTDSDDSNPSAVVSITETPSPGDILIEHWIGYCLGVGGAAAVAAVIGAAAGQAIPIVQRAAPLSVSIDTVASDDSQDATAPLRASVQAGMDSDHRTTLKLAIPHQA